METFEKEFDSLDDEFSASIIPIELDVDVYNEDVNDRMIDESRDASRLCL